MSRRTERLCNLIRQEISALLQREVSDPRLGGLISVTRVSLSMDLKHATVFVSILGDQARKREMLAGFAAASGFLRCHVAERLKLRRVPALDFRLDDSIEEGARILEVINRISDGDKSAGH